MKLDPKMYPDHPETKMRYIEEELTKRVQYKEKGRSLKHTKTWDFDDINIQDGTIKYKEDEPSDS